MVTAYVKLKPENVINGKSLFNVTFYNESGMVN